MTLPEIVTPVNARKSFPALGAPLTVAVLVGGANELPLLVAVNVYVPLGTDEIP